MDLHKFVKKRHTIQFYPVESECNQWNYRVKLYQEHNHSKTFFNIKTEGDHSSTRVAEIDQLTLRIHTVSFPRSKLSQYMPCLLFMMMFFKNGPDSLSLIYPPEQMKDSLPVLSKVDNFCCGCSEQFNPHDSNAFCSKVCYNAWRILFHENEKERKGQD